MWKSAALLLFLCMMSAAQTVEISPVTVNSGSANIFRITLKPLPGKPLAALQWDLVYRDYFRIEPSGVVSGEASESAGKSVICVRKAPEGATVGATDVVHDTACRMPAPADVEVEPPGGVSAVGLPPLSPSSP